MGASMSGAKGTEGFDRGIENLNNASSYTSYKSLKDNLPVVNSITYEGLYYKYFFETGHEENKLFAPSFTIASTSDPFTGEFEEYLCMGLNSRDDGEGLQKNGGRPPINFSVILDISGSMSFAFEGDEKGQSKIAEARNLIVTGILPHLKPEDSISIVLFNTHAEVLANFQLVQNINMTELKEKVMKVRANGGTTMNVGLKRAVEILNNFKKENVNAPKLSRFFFLTDAIPTDAGDEPVLLKLSKEIAEQLTFVSYIGLGIDFNIGFVNRLNSVKGNNYFTVDSAAAFKKIMDTEFDYVSYANAFDINVRYSGNDITLERIYGSPGYEIPEQGILCKITSIFPSLKEEINTTKGGIVLIKYTRANKDATHLKFTTTYKDASGKDYQDEYQVQLPNNNEEIFSGTAARKGVLLTRYAKAMREFLESKDLEAWKPKFEKFKAYYTKEADELHDENLLNELKIIEILIKSDTK